MGLAAMSRASTNAILAFPMPPHEAEYEISGHRYAVRVWTHEQWKLTEESRRPGHAQPLGTLGWIAIDPAAD